MAVEVFERLGSRAGATGENAGQERRYILRGSDDDSDLKIALVAYSPASFTFADPKPKILKRDFVSLDEQLGPGLWAGSAHYVLKDKSEPDTGESVYSFDTTGGTQHITTSIKTSGVWTEAAKLNAAATQSTFNNAIGVTADGVEGVDITVPVFAWSETHYVADEVVTDAYKGTLHLLTGTVCDAAFRGTQAGETLFLGARGQKRGQGDWELSFNFASSPNVDLPPIGKITGVKKKGWEYLWIRYVSKVTGEGENKILSQVPKFVVVEQVYRDGKFKDLGIGS
jgi:hypothetical protein